ncbi:AAA family ATPase [Arcobacter sp. CECT 8985]|uniref:AAA family ATPase n=1 Tax=Arcobacter sp. CECT 8985 TaxID=1935424 RepID=UPI00100A52F7|nr:AAA family ATPase [Arcobacter sp. CECT 8985]RXJ84265.1 DNA helicase UvrD [Arcobacter sp. CECT 8985]
MDKRIIFAVAGAGKTTTIINKLSLEENSLIVTYTENNFINLKKKVIDKFGYLPTNIKIYTYFNFLYSFCYRPFLSNKLKSKGIYFERELPEYSERVKDTKHLHYRDKTNRLYHNRIAKLLVKTNVVENINERIEKYFDNMFVDEIQDFGGHDFNLLNFLTQANVNINFVGDFFQHTFDTSKDGNVNQNLYKDLTKYIKRFVQMGLIIDTESLGKSYRCSSTICNFVKQKLGVNIESHNDNTTNVFFIEEVTRIKELFENNSIVKLFYQNSNKYNCFSMNWGKSKGQDHYNDVCIVLNPTTLKKYRDDTLLELPASTRNKLYVACTRCRGNLYLVDEKLVRHYKN